MKNMTKQRFGALLLLTGILIYGIGALNIPQHTAINASGFTARTFPLVLSVGGILQCLLLIFLQPNEEGAGNAFDAFYGLDWIPAAILVGWMVIYGITMMWIGFLLSTSLFLAGAVYIMGERNIVRILLASIPIALVFWLLVAKLFGLYLAPGELFS